MVVPSSGQNEVKQGDDIQELSDGRGGPYLQRSRRGTGRVRQCLRYSRRMDAECLGKFLSAIRCRSVEQGGGFDAGGIGARVLPATDASEIMRIESDSPVDGIGLSWDERGEG